MPLIFSVDSDNSIYQGQVGIVVSGDDFGMVAPDPLDPENFAALIGSPTADINDVSRLVLTNISAWANDQIVVTVPTGIPAGTTYWFVIRFDGLQSVDGIPVRVSYVPLTVAQRWLLAADSLTWFSEDHATLTPVLTTASGESRVFAFDFSRRAEVIAGATLVGIPVVTTDATSGLTIGAPTIALDGTRVLVRLTPASPTMYLLTCVTTASSGATLIGRGYLRIGVTRRETLWTFPAEVRRYEFDFSQRVEILSGARLTGVPLMSVDDSNLIALGAPLIDTTGTKAQLQIYSTATEKLYQASCLAVTDGGDTLIGIGDLFLGSGGTGSTMGGAVAVAPSGEIWEDSPAALMARLVNINSGTYLVQADLLTITYNVFDLGGLTPGVPTQSGSLVIGAVIFDTLQTDLRWTQDGLGYNFFHLAPGTWFPAGEHRYRVEYRFTPGVGEAFMAVFEVITSSVLSS